MKLLKCIGTYIDRCGFANYSQLLTSRLAPSYTDPGGHPTLGQLKPSEQFLIKTPLD